MARMTLAELEASLYREPYTPRTEEQLRKEAEGRYQTQYNQQRQTAQQTYAAKDLALDQELSKLGDALAVGQETIARDTANSIASAGRYQLTRGMQRSSYGAANNANLAAKGQQNILALQKQYETDVAGVASQKTLLAQQLAETLAQYDIDYLNDVQSYIDEQKQVDYDRAVASQQYANEMNLELYRLGKSSGGSRRSYSSGYTQPPTNDDTSNDSGSLFDALGARQGAAKPLAGYLNKNMPKRVTK